jgi:release factor glutamine methyltransferase
LKQGVPLQYISKTSYFYKSEFFVDRRVLIPRSETEILVEKACEFVSSSPMTKMRIAEVGVGTGAIGLSLLQEVENKELYYLGIDISQDAIDVFKINHFRHAFKISGDHKVDLQIGDRLEGIEDKFDVIISNPPYIKENDDLKLVHKQVKEFEPHVALFLADNIYEQWFKDFFSQSSKLLNDGGIFLMEGHESHLTHLKTLAQEIFNKSVEVIKDYNDQDRFLCIRN